MNEYQDVKSAPFEILAANAMSVPWFYLILKLSFGSIVSESRFSGQNGIFIRCLVAPNGLK